MDIPLLARRPVSTSLNSKASELPVPNTAPATKPSDQETIEDSRTLLRPVRIASESMKERLLKKHAPAWVVSGAIHVALIGTLLAFELLSPRKPEAPPLDVSLTIVNDAEPETKPLDLTNVDVGIDTAFPSTIDAEQRAEVNVQEKPVALENPGAEAAVANVKLDVVPNVGSESDDALLSGIKQAEGNAAKGDKIVGGDFVIKNEAFQGRGGASKNDLLLKGGGNAESEAAVARGLAWLSRQQKPNGSWKFDKAYDNETAGATGLALLPFLAAGKTHKPAKDNKYDKTVAGGLKWLLSHQQSDGSFIGGESRSAPKGMMYSQAIATLALCEAYGMTGDASLRSPAQKAVNFIIESQGPDGSWGYYPKNAGDTSIVGWQIQALQSAKLSKDLRVSERTIEKAREFLDSVASGPDKSRYGYRGPQPTPTMSGVGLLCRYYIDGWRSNSPGMINGVEYLLDPQNPGRNRGKAVVGQTDIYCAYYSTQVIHYFGGKEWSEEWNPKMRDALIKSQIKGDRADTGSWEDSSYGRLFQTSLSLLTLEVYYRFLPTYKERNAGMATEVEKMK